MKYIINMFHLRSYCRSAQNRSLLCLLSSGVRLLRLHLESCIDKSLIYLIHILYHTFVYLSSISLLCYNFIFPNRIKYYFYDVPLFSLAYLKVIHSSYTYIPITFPFQGAQIPSEVLYSFLYRSITYFNFKVLVNFPFLCAL